MTKVNVNNSQLNTTANIAELMINLALSRGNYPMLGDLSRFMRLEAKGYSAKLNVQPELPRLVAKYLLPITSNLEEAVKILLPFILASEWNMTEAEIERVNCYRWGYREVEIFADELVHSLYEQGFSSSPESEPGMVGMSIETALLFPLFNPRARATWDNPDDLASAFACNNYDVRDFHAGRSYVTLVYHRPEGPRECNSFGEYSPSLPLQVGADVKGTFYDGSNNIEGVLISIANRSSDDDDLVGIRSVVVRWSNDSDPDARVDYGLRYRYYDQEQSMSDLIDLDANVDEGAVDCWPGPHVIAAHLDQCLREHGLLLCHPRDVEDQLISKLLD